MTHKYGIKLRDALREYRAAEADDAAAEEALNAAVERRRKSHERAHAARVAAIAVGDEQQLKCVDSLLHLMNAIEGDL